MLIALRYRSRTEIIAQMLETAKGGANKTKIMYSACVSYTQLKYYLEMLETSGLLSFDRTDCRYKTTAKGVVYLMAHQQIRDLTTSKAFTEI